MNLIRKVLPDKIKIEAKYFLMSLLKIPFNRAKIPLEIAKWMPNDKPINFIDIGASTGEFSKKLSDFYTIQRGIIIEPLADLIPGLNARFSDDKMYSVFNLAIAESASEMNFHTFDDYDYVSSFYQIKPGKIDLPGFDTANAKTIKVKTERLDNVVSNCKITHIDLLKIDVQGAEHVVLLSGLNTLKNTRLVYLEFSYQPIYEGSSTFFDLYKTLTDNNFRLVNVEPGYTSANGELLQGDALFLNNSEQFI